MIRAAGGQVEANYQLSSGLDLSWLELMLTPGALLHR